MESSSFIVEAAEAGKRLDLLLPARFPHLSRHNAQRLIREGWVQVNANQVKKQARLEAGDHVEITFVLPPPPDLTPEKIPLDILFEDEELLAIHKPAGMVVHPGAGHTRSTFLHALLYHCKEVSEIPGERPGIVHRLDKETSGVLLAAKTSFMHQALQEAFAKREIKKTYHAIVVGRPIDQTIEKPISRHPRHRKQMACQGEGRQARTTIHTLASSNGLAYLEVHPETGRTHQIRVHLQTIGFPILGDSLYGNPTLNRKWKTERHLLHASNLLLTHPRTKKRLEINAPFPDDFAKMVNRIST